MHTFLCTHKPRSVNAAKKESYYQSLQKSLCKYNGIIEVQKKPLYGFVCYFYRGRTDLDADNLSKPIWDALTGIAYPDDDVIRFRSSGVFNIQDEDITVLDLSEMPDQILEDFMEMIDTEEQHILYVEFGDFDFELLRFGYESRQI